MCKYLVVAMKSGEYESSSVELALPLSPSSDYTIKNDADTKLQKWSPSDKAAFVTESEKSSSAQRPFSTFDSTSSGTVFEAHLRPVKQELVSKSIASRVMQTGSGMTSGTRTKRRLVASKSMKTAKVIKAPTYR